MHVNCMQIDHLECLLNKVTVRKQLTGVMYYCDILAQHAGMTYRWSTHV